MAAADRFLADADLEVTEVVLVAADPGRTHAAISAADVSGDRLLGIVGGLSDLDRRLGGDRVPARRLGELLGPTLGFTILGDEPGKLFVVGLAARYSPFDRAVERLAPGAFASFDEAGYVKAVVAFVLHAQGDGQTLLTCAAHVRAIDDDTRSSLVATSFMLAPAARLLCRRLLALVKHEAESGSEGAEGGDGDRDQHDADRLGPR